MTLGQDERNAAAGCMEEVAEYLAEEAQRFKRAARQLRNPKIDFQIPYFVIPRAILALRAVERELEELSLTILSDAQDPDDVPEGEE